MNFGGYPMSCEIMKSDGSAKKDMIVNGCPSMINNIGRKAKLIQNIENLSITKVKLKIDQEIIPWGR